MQFLFFGLYILLAIVILLVMVTIHEFGHYIAGRLLGFKIVEFAIGMGPAIAQWTNKRGEKISIRALPLGGYCAFYGEEGPGGDSEAKEHKNNETVFEGYTDIQKAEEKPAREGQDKALSFEQHKPWKRLIVFFSGGAFNILSGVIFSFIFLVSVPVVPRIVDFQENSPNALLLQKGDIVLEVNGTEVTHLNNFSTLLSQYKEGEVLTFTVIRDGKKTQVDNLVMTKFTYTDENGKQQEFVGIGIQSEYIHQGFVKSLRDTIPFTIKMGGLILDAFGGLLRGQNLDQLTGPVGTIGAMAEISAMNILNVLVLLPIIAINLGIVNLLPIPALDGSKIVFVLIEWIRGKPINRKVENIIHLIGFIVLIGLMFSVDIIHFFRNLI